jgi:hypothetical protein
VLQVRLFEGDWTTSREEYCMPNCWLPVSIERVMLLALVSGCRNPDAVGAAPDVAISTTQTVEQTSTRIEVSRAAVTRADVGMSDDSAVLDQRFEEILLRELSDFAGSCSTKDVSWPVIVRLRNRKRTTLVAVQHMLAAEAGTCFPNGEVEFSVGSPTLEKLFGSHISLNCSSGMGNSHHTSSLSVQIEPVGYMPTQLARLVSSVSVDADPKRELIGDESTDCNGRFR